MLKISKSKAKYKLLIDKREIAGWKHLNYSKAFIEYLNDMNDVYNFIEEYNPNKQRKILVILLVILLAIYKFDDIIGNMLSNKKLNPIVTELFIRS